MALKASQKCVLILSVIVTTEKAGQVKPREDKYILEVLPRGDADRPSQVSGRGAYIRKAGAMPACSIGACPQKNSRGHSLLPAQSLQRSPCSEVFLKPRTVCNLQPSAFPSLG